MSKQLRVHILAKELSVSSKDILEKCRAEGIELQNHMATISAGLAESIREWFSAGADVTSVEAAAPVDLTRVVKKRKRPAARTATEPADAPPPAVETPTEAPRELEGAQVEPVAEPVPEPPTAAPGAPADVPSPAPVVIEVPAAASAAETGGAPAVSAPAGPEAQPEAPAAALAAEAAPPPMPPVLPAAARAPAAPPPPPEPVRPAGPQLVPRPAALQGPRVVRIEAPEPVRVPRPRPAALAPAAPAPSVAGGATEVRKGPRRGKEDEREVVRTHARSPRRQGGTDVVERIREWRDQDILERKERLASATGHGLRDRRAAERRRMIASAAPAAAPSRRSEVEIVAPILLKDFCEAIGTKFSVVHAKLLEHTGKLYTLNQSLDAETAELVSMELGVTIRIRKARTALERLQDEFRERPRHDLQPRPPIVAMLGHVDHGKTSLLDAIRRTEVAAGEAGGITQRIGAYRIDRGDWHVTFLDTPGHEAFTAMRARGANLTDVVVLVVAADDGIMPQTIEALNHARAAAVPIVVALNKIDLPHDLNRLYAQLSEHDLTPSEWGGNTDVIKTSATTGQGIDELIAHLSTLSELLDLKADPSVAAHATVIDAEVREGRGSVATVLVREGTLQLGQCFVCGPAAGRVRSLIDDAGQRVRQAGPGTPVEVGGLDELPRAGDGLFVVGSLAEAKAIAAEVAVQRREEALQAIRKPQTLEDLLRSGEEGEIPDLNVILKADGQASVDALRGKLGELPSDKARLRILHAAVGTVSEADVVLAQTSRAVIFGFSVVADDRARQLAEQVGVEIRLYRVIYDILDDVRKALEGLLEPLRREEVRGKAEVRQVFNIGRVGTVAGCLVVEGTITRAHRVRLVRDGRVVLEGSALASLKRHKDDAREVRAGLECGIKIDGFDDVKPGDVIETFEVVEVAQRL